MPFYRGADIVEVAPAYDHGRFSIILLTSPTCPADFSAAEITGIAAADLVHDFLSLFLTQKPPKYQSPWVPVKDEL